MKLITWSSPSPAFGKRFTNLRTTWGELGLGFKSEEAFKAQGVCQVACSLPGVSSSKLGTRSLNQPWKWLAWKAKAYRNYVLVGNVQGWGHGRSSALCSLCRSLGWGEESEVYPLEADLQFQWKWMKQQELRCPDLQRLVLGSRGRGTLQASAVTKPLVKPGLNISSANSHCLNGTLGAHLQLWDKILCQKFSPPDSIKPCEMLPGSSQQSMYPVFLSLMTLCSWGPSVALSSEG